MANYVIINLDTTGPSNPSIVLENGADTATSELINAKISTGDASTVGYQMKIWGDVNPNFDASIQLTEEDSAWIMFESDKQLEVSLGNTQKTINVKLRDNVHNPSSIAKGVITLDLGLPTVSTTNPDVTIISKQPTKNSSSFTFYASEDFVEFKVKVVASANASHETGSVIGTANGSTGTSGNAGDYKMGQVYSITIKGEDLELASNGDGDKIVKVFVKNEYGDWSA